MVFSARILWKKQQYQQGLWCYQGAIWKKQNGQPVDDHYNKFNRVAEELRKIFSTTSDVKDMQD